MDDVCKFCGADHFAHKRLVCGAQLDQAKAEAAPLLAALRDGIAKFDPGPSESIHYGKAIHSRTCQAIDGHLCDCRVGQWLTAARAALDALKGVE